jgi:hypothetical protein
MASVPLKKPKLPVPASQGTHHKEHHKARHKSADEHTRAETERKRCLFDWCDAMLRNLCLDEAVAAAGSLEELHNITLDVDGADVILAIRAALHPAGGHRPQEHFHGLKEGSLKQILKARFAELKRLREAAIQRGDPRDAGPAPDDLGNVTPADLIRRMLEQYVALSNAHEYVACALWAVHTHVYDRYMQTPRLLLTSPVRGCGKSVVLKVLNRLVARPKLTDNITAAAIYDIIDRKRCTMLIDEADNLELSAKAALRSVLNSGYEKRGSFDRGTGKQHREYLTFAPVALASIGILTLPLMSRTIVIHMRRHDEKRRFDWEDTRELDLAYQHVCMWAGDVVLNRDPDIPAEVPRGRPANNWRPLIAIADACGGEWGRLAREAAVTFAGAYRDEDIIIILLRDIRDIFNARKVDRLTSKTLVDALNAMDDAGWSEWCGLHDDQRPRKLTQGELARLLRLLTPPIRPRSIWAAPRRPGDSSAKGYYRADFEADWRAYCDEGGTPAQANKIKVLFGP